MNAMPEVIVVHAPEPKRSSFLAAVLALVVPGLGHLYKGRVVSAVLWFAITGFAYSMFIVPGVVLHAFNVLFAALARSK